MSETTAMKLVFPNGEHAPISLKDGVTLVGSASECALMLVAPNIATHHCEIHVQGAQAVVKPINPQAITILNGRQIVQETAFKAGDLLLFAKIGCRVVAQERKATITSPARKPVARGDDTGQTRVRMAMPKFLLRGVSGPTFGKSFALMGNMTLGRQNDCDICIPSDEISRHHLKLQVLPNGVMVEDLGSANGSFINNKRIQGSEILKSGDELRLDTVRFLLLAPGKDVLHQTGAPARNDAVSDALPTQSRSLLHIFLGVLLLGAASYAILRYLGKI